METMGPSPQSRVITTALRLSVYPFMHRMPGHPLGIRAGRRAVDAAAGLVRHHPRARIERLARPRGEWVKPVRFAGPPDSAVLYLHGGGYVVCSPRTHRPITSRLAVDTGLPVLVPKYRLAPEHPFPAALEDALHAYEWLLERGVDRIVLAGDSAGGHLAASLTGEICRQGLPSPAGVVLYSPWVDLSCELSTEACRQIRDPYVSAYTARRIGRMVVGSADLTDPRLALLSCPWEDTPPFLIQVGGAEVLRPEAERLAEALTAAGADCRLQIWDDQMHVFQMVNRLVPEARAAMRHSARFINSVLAPAVPEEAVA
jgi:epsilon-lactone hydrolase